MVREREFLLIGESLVRKEGRGRGRMKSGDEGGRNGKGKVGIGGREREKKVRDSNAVEKRRGETERKEKRKG